SITQMVQTVKIPVIAAGGISSLVDIQNVRSSNVAALVVGKALYEKQFSYSEALAITKLK
ncbi:MAG: 1-(5-phosphoribosyl)-5-((5-phosphoribosylamino)methylideneamino)imidazole-4-carboxamide isomerase, partial [Promethearchaeota archaeon]